MATPDDIRKTDTASAPHADQVGDGCQRHATGIASGQPAEIDTGPYAIEQRRNGDARECRLVGPGVKTKWYAGEDQVQRLDDLRRLANFVVRCQLANPGSSVLTDAQDTNVNNEVNRGGEIRH